MNKNFPMFLSLSESSKKNLAVRLWLLKETWACYIFKIAIKIIQSKTVIDKGVDFCSVIYSIREDKHLARKE